MTWKNRILKLGYEIPYRLGKTVAQLEAIPVNYQHLKIQKRSGGKRILSIPCNALKEVQRDLAIKVFARLPVHPATMGFRRGVSIVDHAKIHVGKRLVIGLDIRDFFPNTSSVTVSNCLSYFGWDKTLVDALVRICVDPTSGGLPQGAPTSPILSNIVNYVLDAKLSGYAKHAGASYSRYADDLTFSFGDPKPSHSDTPVDLGSDERVTSNGPFCGLNNLGRFLNGVKHILYDSGYCLNERKTRFMWRGRQQTVCGLVVNDKVAIPRTVRRAIRAAEHRRSLGLSMTNVSPNRISDSEEMMIDQLQGWKSFHAMVQAGVDS